MKANRKEILVVVMIIVVIIIAVVMKETCGIYTSEENQIELITKSETTHEVSVIFINVGKADSMLIQLDGKSFLIDTGKKSSAKTIKKVLDKYEVDKLNAVFLSHKHNDHIGGIEKISKKFPIEKIYAPELQSTDWDGKNDIDKVAEKISVPMEKLSYMDKVQLVDDVYMEVLGPIFYDEQDDNDNSLVLRMFVNGKVFLFSGDMQFLEEETLMNQGIDLSADVYKISNHGNPDATLEKFAKLVSPNYAVVTTDTNKDEDSANPMVLSYFSDSEIFLTQDYELGIRFTVGTDGTITVVDA